MNCHQSSLLQFVLLTFKASIEDPTLLLPPLQQQLWRVVTISLSSLCQCIMKAFCNLPPSLPPSPLLGSGVKPHVHHVWSAARVGKSTFSHFLWLFWEWITLAQWRGVRRGHKTSRFASVQMRDVSAQHCRCLHKLNDAARILKNYSLWHIFFLFLFPFRGATLSCWSCRFTGAAAVWRWHIVWAIGHQLFWIRDGVELGGCCRPGQCQFAGNRPRCVRGTDCYYLRWKSMLSWQLQLVSAGVLSL